MRLAQTILHDVTVRLDSVTASLAWPVERVTVACYSTLTSQGMAVIVSTRNLFNWGYRTAIVWLLSYSVIHGYNTSGKSKNKNLGQRKVRVLLRGTLKKLFGGGRDWWEKGRVSKFWGVKRVDVDNESLVKGKHHLHAEGGGGTCGIKNKRHTTFQQWILLWRQIVSGGEGGTLDSEYFTILLKYQRLMEGGWGSWKFRHWVREVLKTFYCRIVSHQSPSLLWSVTF